MVKRIIGVIALSLFAVSANAGLIAFDAVFVVDGPNFSPRPPSTAYNAKIIVDDTCGSNADYSCSNSNAILNFAIEGQEVGTNAGWDTISFSAMADYFFGGPLPFAYIDPDFDDVFFEFSNNDGSLFAASIASPDDTRWLYIDAAGRRTFGDFEILRRVPVPNTGTLALLVLGLAGLGFGRRKAYSKLH